MSNQNNIITIILLYNNKKMIENIQIKIVIIMMIVKIRIKVVNIVIMMIVNILIKIVNIVIMMIVNTQIKIAMIKNQTKAVIIVVVMDNQINT